MTSRNLGRGPILEREAGQKLFGRVVVFGGHGGFLGVIAPVGAHPESHAGCDDGAGWGVWDLYLLWKIL
jgi:hypothetical protein